VNKLFNREIVFSDRHISIFDPYGLLPVCVDALDGHDHSHRIRKCWYGHLLIKEPANGATRNRQYYHGLSEIMIFNIAYSVINVVIYHNIYNRVRKMLKMLEAFIC